MATRKTAKPRSASTSNPAGYSGTPLPKKLGIKPDTTTGLVSAPDGFEALLGETPGAVLRRDPRTPCDLVVWFTTSERDLRARLATVTSRARTGLWIAWPKRASGVASDLSEGLVREIALANGLVDYKVCAIDATWAGLKFAHRKAASVR